ncbi:MAG: Fic family protein [Elusimicrobiales bacterium]|nr:Fic family protein [Elusimicrobiales bacterium]
MYKPDFKVPARAYRLLESIAEIKERIRASAVKVPWVPSLVKDAMARAAWGSTAIEGCTLSLEAVKGLMEGKKALGYPNKDVRMAQNYLAALEWLQKREKAAHITEKDVLFLHKLMGEGACDEGPIGAYRRLDVRAGLHVGAPWKQVPGLMKDLLHWLDTGAKEFPAVFSSAMLHLRFVEIHPFRDGNGRVARALATWQLYRAGFDTLHVFALDEILLENRALYIKALQRVQVEGEDLGSWLEFISEAVLETLERVQGRIASLGLKDKGLPASLTLRQEKLLRTLRERGPLGIREIARALRLTAPGAHYALRPLLNAGIISTEGAHKNTKYLLK